ncbi:MAG: error-prone DNA polymerase [Phycisphaerae bacterium]|nr:error-prone DNA polymerase [Phycisphaerae bacterium]
MPEGPLPKIRPNVPAPSFLRRGESSIYPYAELEVMTNFSFLQGASHPDELVYRAAELGYAAIAITDLNSLAGIVRAHVAAKQASLKLLVGARLRFTDAPDVLVWMPNRTAYGRLCRLLTLGRQRAEKGKCTLSIYDFLDHSEGMIAALCPVRGGDLSRHPKRESPFTTSRSNSFIPGLLKDALGSRLSLAFCRDYDGTDEQRFQQQLWLSSSLGIPLLATNHIHYHVPQRRPLQDVLACVRHKCSLSEAGYRLLPNGERYLKHPGQMHRLFADHPQAVRRGIEIADQCSFTLDELKYEYPDELVPAGKTSMEHLIELTWAGAAERYPQGIPAKIGDQIHHEFALIESEKFPAYFLTVHDLVRFARSQNILCQGRGSAANSVVCYCLGVTSVNPEQIDVLFERFISGARGEPPDIDINFEHERREEVIQYIYAKYGRERAGMTATLITYRGRSAVRDVGKALGLSIDVVDMIAGRLDWWHSGKLSDDDLRAAGLNADDPTVRLLIERTTEILGFPRHLSQHVSGMVMTRGPLCELVPIENASMENRTVIEWDKDDIDSLRILKVDVLALGMLTCISKCLAMLNEHRDPATPPIELHTVPREDPAVYEMISNADTIGVFQIESRAQMTMLPRLRPKEFYDLVIEVAIVRPGPIQGDMVHPYLRRRNGLEKVSYPKEELKEVLHKTLGVPLFQEQAMRLVMVAAGFSADEADQLRRAMASWKQNGHIERFHDKVIQGMLKNGYTKEFAEQLFQQILGFAGYGFPESHSASFARLVYVSAWIKRYHPAIFCCGLLNSLPMGFYAPAQLVRDAREHGVEVRPVDVNFSDWKSTLEDELRTQNSERRTKCNLFCVLRSEFCVRLGFDRIKGMRESDALQIMAARQRVGRFTSVEQFHQATRLSTDAIERLAHADAFQSLGDTRRPALWNTLALKNEQLPLFDESVSANEVVSLPMMPLGQEVLTDYATSSLSLKAHPVSLVRAELKQRGIITAAELNQRKRGWVKVAGLVLIRQRPGTASGIVFITIEDETGVANLIVRPELFDRYRQAARHAYLLQADGYVERQGQVIHVMAKQMHDLSFLLNGHVFRSRDFH